MNVKPLRTVVIGFGKMSSTYANDPVMAKYYPYATHAQVLAVNPHFEWLAVVDPVAAARDDAQNCWKIPAVADVKDLGALVSEIEVAVLATPPESRIGIIDSLPNLRAVLVEKPLGRSLKESIEFLESCSRRNIHVQVNFWRRADSQFQQLKAGSLSELVGEIQIAHGIYGNGLLNNGVHLIDFIRMLFGEVESVAPLGKHLPFNGSPIIGDINCGFVLSLSNGLVLPIQPVQFTHYREVGLEIWGQNGHLAILNEGLTLTHREREANRGMSGEYELPFDKASYLTSTVGDALFRMYDDLARALDTGSAFCSPGESALRTATIVEAVLESQRRKQIISINEYMDAVC